MITKELLKMSKGAKSALLILALLLLPAAAILRTDKSIDQKWYEDFAQAQKMASQQGKDLLVDFTGSDWCSWCWRLEEEVFSQDHFKKKAPEDFILVKLDFPRDKSKMSQEIIEQNEKLAREYPFPGFPTIYLMDADSRPYAQTGYQQGGPEKYVEHLSKLHAVRVRRDEFIAQTRDKFVVENGERKKVKVEPLKKARLLDQALSIMDDEIVAEFYVNEVQKIIELDADNAAGLKSKYQLRLRLNEAQKVLNSRDYKKAVEMMDAVIKDLNLIGETAQKVLYIKCEGLFYLQDMKALEKGLREAYQAAPKGKLVPDIKKKFERFFPDKDIGKK